MEVRPAELEDVVTYSALGRAAQAWLRSRGLGQYVPAAYEEYAATIRSRVESGTLFMVQDGGEAIGSTLRPELALHFPHGTFPLDAARKPRTIDFAQIYGFPQEKPVLVPGIYELDGETLKICRATSGDKRPTDFTTNAGSGREVEARPLRPQDHQQAPPDRLAAVRDLRTRRRRVEDPFEWQRRDVRPGHRGRGTPEGFRHHRQ